MYKVYILKNSKGRLYKGHTSDINKRIKDHKSGKNSYTRDNGPWILVYQEDYLTKSDAIKREMFFKSGKGRELLKSILKTNCS